MNMYNIVNFYFNACVCEGSPVPFVPDNDKSFNMVKQAQAAPGLHACVK